MKIKLNGSSGIVAIIITLLLATGGILIKIGDKKAQVNRNTTDIVEVKSEQKDFRKEINTKFEVVAGDLGLIKGALGIKKQARARR